MADLIPAEGRPLLLLDNEIAAQDTMISQDTMIYFDVLNCIRSEAAQRTTNAKDDNELLDYRPFDLGEPGFKTAPDADRDPHHFPTFGTSKLA